MNERGKSDNFVVPEKSANNDRAAVRPAERMEERELTKGNPLRQNKDRTQRRATLHSALERVRQAARRDRKERFTALWHHVHDEDRLREAYMQLNRRGSPGVDGRTWRQYREELDMNLSDLSGRLQRGAYRAKPVVRAYVPKGDDQRRPIGIPTLEDKVVQRAATEVLNAVYEVDFKGFSYGSRPGRSPHDALNALAVGIQSRKVNWVLDADIRGFFDSIDHGLLVKFIEHRIADKRVIRHVKKWLKAGVLEDGHKTIVDEGTPQGGSISPLLANIYLHYVLDLWVDHWRKHHERGDVIIVRYVDDFVVGFQHRAEAERFLKELHERLGRFNLELHATKTRLIEFGRFAAKSRSQRGDGKPETFDFLGFTHYCGRSKRGWFMVGRKTVRKKMKRKLKELKRELRRRLHQCVPQVGKYLRSVLTGHYRYFGVPGNGRALSAFQYHLFRLWYRTLKRRSQRCGVTFDRMARLARRWLPWPRLHHDYPSNCLRV